jgi:hypothetical protein
MTSSSIQGRRERARALRPAPSKDLGFAVKVAVLNALAFSIVVAGVTYIDARLTSHVAFGARTYPYGYPIAMGGGPVVFGSTLLVLARASSWKVRATVPAAILAAMAILTLPFFRPEFPHGGISVWLAQFSIVSLLTCYIHFLPWPARLASEELGAAVKWERLKEYGALWRTIAVAVTIGYMIILIPWSNFIWSLSPHIVRDPAQAYVLSEFGAAGMVGVTIYVILGVLYESFRRTHEAADLALRYKPGPPAGAAPEPPRGSARNQVFVSHSHLDKEWLNRLLTMLKPLEQSGAISIWTEASIEPGARWREELQRALASTRVAVLLVSSHFLGSEFITREELPPLFSAAERGEVKILWVYLSSCRYDATPIGDYQAAHAIKKPLDQLSKAAQSRALWEVANAIEKAMG